jgi:ribonuclease D
MNIITTTEKLKDLCERLTRIEVAQKGFITLDTEFIREKTYWPELCLIQLAGSEENAIIDPLAPNLDLTPLLAVMKNPQILKVFHAGRQDLEIFYKIMGDLPQPIFDTQIAAMVCGYGDSIGYETLAKEIAGATLDKSARYTDWSFRPLSEKQLSYALADVIHLREIYKKFQEKLENEGRLSWIEEEMAILKDPLTYQVDAEEVWRRIRIQKNDRRYLGRLRAMAVVREKEAQQQNKPRGRIVKDEVLSIAALQNPRSIDEFNKISGRFQKGLPGGIILKLFKAVEQANALDPDKLPKLPERPRGFDNIGSTVDILRVLLRSKGNVFHVAEKLIANTSDLEKLASLKDKATIKALKGWRYEVFGKDALLLLEGKLSISLKDNQLVIIPA